MLHICPYCKKEWDCYYERDYPNKKCSYPKAMCCNETVCTGKEEEKRVKNEKK